MATTIPDLWPDDIRVNVLTPVAILKAQEGILAKKTQGLLEARLSTNYTEERVQHDLDLIAPALGYYRERVLSAIHDRDRVYPVTVISAAFIAGQKIAETEEKFVKLVAEVLQSIQVRGLIQSLIARSNENGPSQPPVPSQPPGDGSSGKP